MNSSVQCADISEYRAISTSAFLTLTDQIVKIQNVFEPIHFHRYMKENNLSYGLRDDDDAVSKMAEAFGVSTTALAIRLGRVLA